MLAPRHHLLPNVIIYINIVWEAHLTKKKNQLVSSDKLAYRVKYTILHSMISLLSDHSS